MKIPRLYPNCTFTRGYLETLLIDLQQNKSQKIKNILFDLIFNPNEKAISNKLLDVRESLISELYDSGWILNDKLYDLCKEEFSFEYEEPYSIGKITLFINDNIEFELKNLRSLIDDCLVEALVVDLREVNDVSLLNNIILDIGNVAKGSSLTYVEVLCKNFLSEKKYYQIAEQIPLLRIIRRIAKKDEEIEALLDLRDQDHDLIVVSHTLDYKVKIPDKLYNLPYYTESLISNAYYNRTIFIDHYGSILPSKDGKIICNIRNYTIERLIQNKNLVDLWSSKKDNTLVCMSCEYRHCCSDDNIPKKVSDQSWIRSSECNYNPFIGKLNGEKGYKSLEQCGIKIDNDILNIQVSELEQINAELWW